MGTPAPIAVQTSATGHAPLARLEAGESQMLYDGTPEGLEEHADPRVRQFVRGEAGERLRELAQGREN